MRKRLLTSLVLVFVLVLAISICLTGCKPGYKEVWEPIAPYNYEWDKDNGDLDKIIARVNEDCIIEKNKDRAKLEAENEALIASGKEPKPNYADPEYLLSVLKEDGSFSSIEYDLDTKAFWPPLDHLRNVLFLQVARNDKDNELYYMSEDIKIAVTKAMNYWVEKDYKCEWNWWFNEVGVGMYLPNIILFGVDGLSEESKDKMLGNIEGTLLHKKPLRFKLYERKCNEAGGNLADQALSTLKFCLATRDGNTIMWVTKQIENELRVFPEFNPKHHRWDAEGIKEDFSFQQHDQLLYMGGYGEVMLDGFAKYMRFTRGTQFALSKESRDFFTDFILEGIQFATRGGYRDISASGRGVSRYDSLTGIYKNIERVVVELLAYGDIARADELEQMLVDRYGEVDKGAGGHRYMYMSDWQVMNNDKYWATVRHASKNTRIFEYLNGENPLGYYTGFGATFFYINGDEYYNAPVLWDWNRIPGTTTKQGKVPTMNQDFSYGAYGKSDKVMGVSNKSVGNSYIDVNNKGVSSKKAYFMFEDGVVCLGTDITYWGQKEVVTNINQTNLDGTVTIGNNGTYKVVNVGDKLSERASFVHHDGIAYFVDGDIELSVEHRKGDWKNINERQSSRPAEGDMFTLDINHGKMPVGKSYEYTVLMNVDLDGAKAYDANRTLNVVANTKKVQAVMDSKNGVGQAIFHKAGKVTLGDNVIEVDKGCCLIVEEIDGKVVVTIASNTFKDNDLKIKVNGASQTCKIGKKPISLTF